MVSVLENSTRERVKGGGVGDSQKDASEELEASVDTIIRIRCHCLNTTNQQRRVALFRVAHHCKSTR